jgi:hypothetical protein
MALAFLIHFHSFSSSPLQLILVISGEMDNTRRKEEGLRGGEGEESGRYQG